MTVTPFITLADAWVHDLDPFAVKFPDAIGDIAPFLEGLRWYGLSYLTGFVIGWLLVRWMASTRRSPLTKTDIADMVMWMIMGVLIGGRVGYCLFYDRALLGFSSTPPFWGVLMLHKGGMSSHGGILGVILAAIAFGRRRGFSSLHLLDLAAWACPIGLGLGRIANFINAELWGKRLPDALQADPPWWSVKYPQEILAKDFPREPLFELQRLIPGDKTFFGNVIDAVQNGNAEVIAILRPYLTAYYPSQLYQALTDGVILFTVLTLVWLKPRKPGVIGAWFMMTYGLMRLITEVWRAPDDGVAIFLGLQRGQLLSVPMILVGLAALWLVSRRDAPRYGGVRTIREIPADERRERADDDAATA